MNEHDHRNAYNHIPNVEENFEDDVPKPFFYSAVILIGAIIACFVILAISYLRR